MKKVIIAGLGHSKFEIPQSEDCEYWGLNNLFIHLPLNRWTRWFEIHEFTVDIKGNYLRKGESVFRGMSVNRYLSSLSNLNIPVYTQSNIVANSIIYPKDDIVRRFGNYFTSTHSWMLALAINERFDTIGLYGVDMSDHLHIDKRPAFERLIGFGQALGIKFEIAKSSPILKCESLYGFES